MEGDPLNQLARAAAALQAGDALPADLLPWLRTVLGAALAGHPDPFGTRPARGQRAAATRAAYHRRDQALAAAFSLATGGQLRRGETLLEWWDAWQSGHPVPPQVEPHLVAIERSGVPPPADSRGVVRRVREFGELMP